MNFICSWFCYTLFCIILYLLDLHACFIACFLFKLSMHSLSTEFDFFFQSNYLFPKWEFIQEIWEYFFFYIFIIPSEFTVFLYWDIFVVVQLLIWFICFGPDIIFTCIYIWCLNNYLKFSVLMVFASAIFHSSNGLSSWKFSVTSPSIITFTFSPYLELRKP